VHVVTADGRNLLVYADAHTEKMMTGKLPRVIVRVHRARASLSQNPDDALISICSASTRRADEK
jgi:hypothetical protein